jgi:hypothetical protein
MWCELGGGGRLHSALLPLHDPALSRYQGTYHPQESLVLRGVSGPRSIYCLIRTWNLLTAIMYSNGTLDDRSASPDVGRH